MDGIKCLLKFGEYKHIKSFTEGNLYCSDAVTFWGIEDKKKIKGQGDILEAGARMFTKSMRISKYGTNDTLKINIKTNGLIHIQPAEHMPVFCMFAVGENDCTVDEYGNMQFSFSDEVKETIKTHFPNADSVGIIKDPDAFLCDVKDTIGYEIKHERVHYFHLDKGFPVNNGNDNALDMGYMMYLTQDIPPEIKDGQKKYTFFSDYAYRTLFCKDIFFKNEQEYRIVIPTDTIYGGKSYPVNIRQTIDMISLDDLLK